MGSSLCVHCQTREAEPTFAKCEQCMMKESPPEVRYLRNRIAALEVDVATLQDEIQELRKGAK